MATLPVHNIDPDLKSAALEIVPLRRRIQELEQLESDRKRAEAETSIFVEIGRVIASTLNIDEVYEPFAAEVRKLIQFDRIHVNLNNPDGKSATIIHASGVDIPGRRVGDIVPLEGTITESLCNTRIGMFFNPVSAEELTGRFPNPSASTTFRAGMRSIMAVPLISRDKVIGALHFRSARPNAYTEHDVNLAEKVGMQITGAIANAQLFKELKDAEDSLRESERRFRAIFEQAAVGVAEMDIATGRFLTVNGRLCEIVGRTEEELLATTFLAITHPDDLHLHREGMALLTAGNLPNFTLEKRYVRKNGETVWVSITLSPLWKPGEPLSRNIIVVQDITERKRISAELDRHSNRLAALHEIGTEIISELKLGALIESIVKHACNLIGGAYCTCYLYRPETDLLERVTYIGEARSTGTQLRKYGESFVGHIWSTQTPFLLNDYLSWPGRKKEHDSLPPRAMVGVPINFGDQFLGVLVVTANLPHQFTQTDTETLGMFAAQAAIAIHNAQHYDQMESQIHDRTIELEETNTALRVLIKKEDKNQQRIEESIQSNVNQLVTPFLSRLKKSKTEHERKTYLNIIETNLDSIVSPFINRLSTVHKNLTPKEIQIAELIKQGKGSKEIAELFGVAIGTVITHRNKIRKKLSLKSRNANLRSHLLSLS